VKSLRLEAVSVSLDGRSVLFDVELEVEAGEIVVMLGPSGCGKTTLLRVIAGLQTVSSGGIFWEGIDITNLPSHKRGFGLMFQESTLFPHRDVAQNVSFGLEVAGVSPQERSERVGRMLALVGLQGFENRSVSTLSGGEAQRVALARSLVTSPRLLMLDEPLASLDRSRREELVGEIRFLLRRLGQSAIHVTHDHDEAFELADRIAVMSAGRILRVGTPTEVWENPGTPEVARSVGHRNLVDLDATGSCSLGTLGTGPGTVLVRGDRLEISAEGFPARVTGLSRRSGRLEVAVDIGGIELFLTTERQVEVGEAVTVAIREGAVVALGLS